MSKLTWVLSIYFHLPLKMEFFVMDGCNSIKMKFGKPFLNTEFHVYAWMTYRFNQIYIDPFFSFIIARAG